jgi:hypothetical protein
MRVHRRQLLCRCHTCFLFRRSRAKPEQSCCSFRAIRSMFRSGSNDVFAEQVDGKARACAISVYVVLGVRCWGPEADNTTLVLGFKSSALTNDYNGLAQLSPFDAVTVGATQVRHAVFARDCRPRLIDNAQWTFQRFVATVVTCHCARIVFPPAAIPFQGSRFDKIGFERTGAGLGSGPMAGSAC